MIRCSVNVWKPRVFSCTWLLTILGKSLIAISNKTCQICWHCYINYFNQWTRGKKQGYYKSGLAIFRNFYYYLEKVWYLATQVNPLLQRSLDSKEGRLVWVNDFNLHSHYRRCSVVAIFFVTTKMISHKCAYLKSEGVYFECPYSIRNVLLIMKGKKKGRINVNLFENPERLKAQVLWWVGQWCLIKEEVAFFAIYKRSWTKFHLFAYAKWIFGQKEVYEQKELEWWVESL